MLSHLEGALTCCIMGFVRKVHRARIHMMLKHYDLETFLEVTFEFPIKSKSEHIGVGPTKEDLGPTNTQRSSAKQLSCAES